jgi:ABC-type sugar transport system substrate-binding protein
MGIKEFLNIERYFPTAVALRAIHRIVRHVSFRCAPHFAPTAKRNVLPMNRIIMLVAAGLLAMATSASAETVGFSQVGTESDWRTAFTADMRKEAKLRGIDLHVDDAQQNVERQFAAIRRFIAERLDAIIIAPVVVTGWTPVLQEAQAAHIPVFIADRSVDADASLYVARIAADFNLEGRLGGSWLAQASRGRCNIVELQGSAGAAPTIERKKGFATVISQFPGMRIVRSESGDFTTEGGQRVMAGFIKSTDGLKDICAVWSHNDNMLLGAIDTMKSAGLHPGKDILTISVDGVPGIFRAMLAGDANASVELKSDIGKYIFDVVQGVLQGKHDYPKWVLIPSDLHTPEDAAKMLERRAGS